MTLIYLAIGLVAGVLSGLFGIGGGVVIVPALILLARMPTLTATGTSLGALLLPVGALGAWTYYKNSHSGRPGCRAARSRTRGRRVFRGDVCAGSGAGFAASRLRSAAGRARGTDVDDRRVTIR